MAVWMKSVFSSMISEVGYDTETEELLVKFSKAGKTAAYKGAPEGLAEQLAHAPSVGSMFLSEVKPFYSDWRYL
jgi:KTSC domain